MDTPLPVDVVAVDLVDAGSLARGCVMADRGGALAWWVGREGRPITASRVLRRVDIAAAGVVLGVALPERARTAANVQVLHRPWSFALGAGLLEIEGKTVVAGPVLERWSLLDDAELLDAWLAGMRAVCAAESEPRYEQGVATLAFAFLEVVAERDVSEPDSLWHRVIEVVQRYEDEDDGWSGSVSYQALTRYRDPETGDRFGGLVELLGQLGAVTGDDSQTVAVTALGRWALANARAGRPRLITADLPAGEVAALLADRVSRGMDPWAAMGRWLGPRLPADAARDLLIAAAGVSAAARIGAADVVDGLGEDVVGVWREVARVPQLGPHARAALAFWDQEPRVEPADVLWLAVERAAAALAGPGPDEALARVYERVPGDDLETRLAAVARSGHPEAAQVVEALADFASSGVPRSVDQVYQLQVLLMRWRPPTWRRVLVPATATLGQLHRVIQVLFGWDGDHMHVFEVGAERYSSPFFDLRGLEMGDEFAIRLRDVFTGTTKKIRYEYDFGASWWHEITLEKVGEREPDTAYPVCVAFAGDSPEEYPSEDDPQDPEPFDLAETNRRLTGSDGGHDEEESS